MPEENKEAGESKPVITPEMTAELTRQAVEAATKAMETKTQEAIATAKSEASSSVRSEIISALGGEAQSEKLQTEVLKRWVNDPVSVLNAVQSSTREAILQEVKQTLQTEREAAKEEDRKRRDYATAAGDILESRPDIKSSKEAKELIDAYYLTTSEKMPEKERLAEALKKYDKLVESTSGKSVEDRVKEAASVSTSSNKGKTEAPPRKSAEEINREWLEERKARFKQVSKGQVIARS